MEPVYWACCYRRISYCCSPLLILVMLVTLGVKPVFELRGFFGRSGIIPARSLDPLSCCTFWHCERVVTVFCSILTLQATWKICGSPQFVCNMKGVLHCPANSLMVYWCTWFLSLDSLSRGKHCSYTTFIVIWCTIFVDDSSMIARSQDIGAAQRLLRRKLSHQILGTGRDSYLWQYCQCRTRAARPVLENPVTACSFIAKAVLLLRTPLTTTFEPWMPPPPSFFSIMSQQLIMMQLATGLHSVLNSLNSKGKVSVDGTPKDAVCRLYFSSQLNQLQLPVPLAVV